MPMQGSLATMPIPELLSWISQFQKTGSLEIRAKGTLETMAFDKGELVFSSSTDPNATLGRLLMASGVVTEEMHAKAGDLRKTKSISVAKAFVELQILSEKELLRFLRKKAEKQLFDLCELTEGDFTFTEAELPKLDFLPLRVDVSRMLLRVMQDRDEKGEYDFDSTGIRLEIPRDI